MRTLSWASLAFICGVVLTDCQPLPQPGEHRAATLTVLAEVCNTYSSALRVLIPARAAGRLSESDVHRVEQANAVADVVCMPGAPVPADPLDAISRVNAKTVELLSMAERQGG